MFASLSSTEALKYVSYPVQALTKSGKLIPGVLAKDTRFRAHSVSHESDRTQCFWVASYYTRGSTRPLNT